MNGHICHAALQIGWIALHLCTYFGLYISGVALGYLSMSFSTGHRASRVARGITIRIPTSEVRLNDRNRISHAKDISAGTDSTIRLKCPYRTRPDTRSESREQMVAEPRADARRHARAPSPFARTSDPSSHRHESLSTVSMQPFNFKRTACTFGVLSTRPYCALSCHPRVIYGCVHGRFGAARPALPSLTRPSGSAAGRRRAL